MKEAFHLRLNPGGHAESKYITGTSVSYEASFRFRQRNGAFNNDSLR